MSQPHRIGSASQQKDKPKVDTIIVKLEDIAHLWDMEITGARRTI